MRVQVSTAGHSFVCNDVECLYVKNLSCPSNHYWNSAKGTDDWETVLSCYPCHCHSCLLHCFQYGTWPKLVPYCPCNDWVLRTTAYSYLCRSFRNPHASLQSFIAVHIELAKHFNIFGENSLVCNPCKHVTVIFCSWRKHFFLKYGVNPPLHCKWT